MTKRIGGQSFSEQLNASAHGFMDPEAFYAQLGELIRTMPDLDAPGEISADTHKWLGSACGALVHRSANAPRAPPREKRVARRGAGTRLPRPDYSEASAQGRFSLLPGTLTREALGPDDPGAFPF
jgi:hypothetical protein